MNLAIGIAIGIVLVAIIIIYLINNYARMVKKNTALEIENNALKQMREIEKRAEVRNEKIAPAINDLANRSLDKLCNEIGANVSKKTDLPN